MTPQEIHMTISKLSCIAVDDLESAYLSFSDGKIEICFKAKVHDMFKDSERLREFYLMQLKTLMELGHYTEKHLKHDFNILP